MSKDKEINPFDKYHYSITSSDNGSMSTKKIEEIITDDKTILYGGEAFVDKEYNKDDMMTAYQHGKTIGIHETELSERKRILKEVEKKKTYYELTSEYYVKLADVKRIIGGRDE